jgi:hypothetical protein
MSLEDISSVRLMSLEDICSVRLLFLVLVENNVLREYFLLFFMVIYSVIKYLYI